MRLLLATFFSAAAITGCVSTENTNTSFEADTICDVASLDSKFTAVLDRSAGLRGALGVGVLMDESALTSDNNHYVLSEKLNHFDAEINDRYRDLTSNCKAVTRCMEVNAYEEQKCQQVMRRLEDSKREFRDVISEFRKIEEEVARTAILSEPKRE